MPYGIETFSFDLFGLGRRLGLLAGEKSLRDRSHRSAANGPAAKTAEAEGAGAKDAGDGVSSSQIYFSGMFPVL